MRKVQGNVAYADALREVDRLASAVAERGYDDVQQEWDNYADLLQSYEFRKLVTFELYEAYFPPKRHEFELHLLTQLMDAVTASNPTVFLTEAAVGGVVGGAVYDMIKQGLSHIAKRFTKIRRTRNAVQEIGKNVEMIRAYMNVHDDVPASQISFDTDIEAYKVEPLLKLLGCRSHRVKKKRFWRKPEAW